MIRYDLKCAKGCEFESWFASSAAYDALAAAGMVSCAVCGGDNVEKALMAPRVRTARKTAEAAPEAPRPSEETAPVLSAPAGGEVETMLRKLRAEIEAKSDYVGDRFASEARAMYVGDKEHRAIHGEATKDEAKSLMEDGVPVAPLPFRVRRDG